MIYNDVIFGTTPADLVPINKFELSARLGTNISLNEDMIIHYINQYNENVTYRYAFVRVPVNLKDGICYIDDIKINSSSLCKVLSNSNEAILLAVTAGIGIDKLIAKNEILNPTGAFYIDAIASAGIDSYMDYISKETCKGLNVTNRFSPGYGDFSIKFQEYLLNRIYASQNIGIMLSNEYFMTPMKSITAVIGIKDTKGV